MDISPSAYPAIGAVMAAVIGGAISFIVTVLSKEQKTSEFRQAWIDSLRDDLSEFISTVDALASFLRFKTAHGQGPGAFVAFLQERYEDFLRMGVSYHRIMLRLNPEEHTKLIGILKQLSSVLGSHAEAIDEGRVDQIIAALVAESQAVLKSEWKRVKRGEVVFILTKYVSLALFIMSVGVAVAIARGYLIIAFRP